MLVIPIVGAAQRLQLRGTLVVLAVTAGTLLGGTVVIDQLAMAPEVMVSAVAVLSIVAILSGAQSNAYAQQVTQLQHARQQLEHQAGHDALTGLPNRTLVEQYAADLGGRAVAVLLLDLDGFKRVNDTFGHATGDAMLTTVARRIELQLRPGDMPARLGGDEFTFCLRTPT